VRDHRGERVTDEVSSLTHRQPLNPDPPRS
jgi:hypothetical protein